MHPVTPTKMDVPVHMGIILQGNVAFVQSDVALNSAINHNLPAERDHISLDYPLNYYRSPKRGQVTTYHLPAVDYHNTTKGCLPWPTRAIQTVPAWRAARRQGNGHPGHQR